MPKIIKTTTGQADFVVKEEYQNENQAIEGKDPSTQDAEVTDLKIENVKYKLKEVLKNEWSEIIKIRKKT